MESVNELGVKYFNIFLPKIKNMKKSEAMDTLVINARQSRDAVKNIRMAPGFSTDDYNAMVRWVVILDAVKKAVEQVHGDFLKLKADYPDKYADYKKANDDLAVLVETMKGRSTDASDLLESQHLESKIEELKTTVGLTEDDLKAIGAMNWDLLTKEQIAGLQKFAKGRNGSYLNQIFGSVEGQTFRTVVQQLSGGVGLTSDPSQKDGISPIAIGAAAVVGILALKG